MQLKPRTFKEYSRKRAYNRRRRPVKWNDLEFESLEKLRGHLRLENTSKICLAIKNKKELKGHIPEYIPKTNSK